MPKSLNMFPAERVDLDDYLYGAVTFPRAVQDLQREIVLVDNQSRIVRGFTIEVPDQTIFPGRLVVHAGAAVDPTGQILFNDDQRNVSRTVTLEGASTTFWLEIEFTESESDVDDRAFWDPTVDQGTDPSGDDKPDGQEFSNSVATRNTPDWQVVTPIITGAFVSTPLFSRQADPNSTKIPLLQVSTDANNQITLSTTTPRTTLLEVVTTTPGKIRVQDPTHFGLGDVELGVGLAAPPRETLTVAAVDYDAGTVTFTGNITSPNHNPGEIVQRTDASAPNIANLTHQPRYGFPGSRPDHRDFLFRGDEVHGEILSEGHSTTPDDQSDDVNLQSLKDHIDFLAAQLEELKWGHRNPYESGTSTEREPPGLTNDVPSTPRYFHKSGGLQGARNYTLTVGDGTESWGDFVGADETSIQRAIDQSPTNGTVYVKRGTYDLSADVVVNKGVVLVFDNEATINNEGGGFDIQTNARVDIQGLRMAAGAAPTTRGLYFNTLGPSSLRLTDIILVDVGIEVSDGPIPFDTVVDQLSMTGGSNMASTPLINVTNAAGRVQGSWTDCQFAHGSASGLTGTILDAATGAATYLVFKECYFNSNSALGNTNSVHLGGTAVACRDVVFRGCYFSTPNTVAHIRAGGAAGGQNLQLLGCVQFDTFAALLGANSIEGVTVDGLRRAVAGAPGFGVEFDDCNKIKIVNCDLTINALFDFPTLLQAAIIIRGYGADVDDVVIDNCTIEGDATLDSSVGIAFDINNANTIQGVRISNNKITQCEAGVIFRVTDATAGVYKNIKVDDNIIDDVGVSATVADTLKLGIYTDANGSKSAWSICRNTIRNVNPATAAVLDSQGRHGIMIRGVGNTYFTVSDNIVENVGDSSNRNGSAAISMQSADYSTVSGNIVDGVFGTGSRGMRVGVGNRINNTTVSGNTIRDVDGDTANGVHGIEMYGCEGCTITGNVIEQMTTTASGTLQGGIAIRGGGTERFKDSTLSDNVVNNDVNSNLFGILINANRASSSSITGNVVTAGIGGNVWLRGLSIDLLGVSSRLDQLTITGNRINGVDYGAHIGGGGGSILTFNNISGNTFGVSSTGSYGLFVEGLVSSAVNGNIVYYSGTATGIYLLTCSYIQCSNNIIECSSGAGTGIAFFGGDVYVVSFNLFNNAGAGAPASYTSAAAGTTGIIQGNLVDEAPTGSTTHHAAPLATGTIADQYVLF